MCSPGHSVPRVATVVPPGTEPVPSPRPGDALGRHTGGVPHDTSAAVTSATEPGSVWVDGTDPTLLWMAGEVDVAVVERLRERVGADSPRGSELATHLRAVRTVDMRAVTFADSSAVGLLAGLVVGLEPTGEQLVVRGIGPVVETVLEVTGLLPRLTREP